MKKNLCNLTFLVSLLFAVGCGPTAQKQATEHVANSKVYTHPSWTKNANIYEVNIRQYTNEGTFAAFEKHMPRLKEMGVDILWIMPIHPIGEINRKGTLGSYYAVKDYQQVNPEFGNMEDFKHMVSTAHELGMYVIIDWVANHTSWDNWLMQSHPDWYTRDSLNKVVAPVADWADVADLDYNVPELREYIAQSMEFWVKEANIDGYRCDVACMVPTDFWINVRVRLDSIKPVFMLAECESKEILSAFDMIYGWDFHHIMNQIAQKKQDVQALNAYFTKIDTVYDADEYYMNFTSNHDENSWNGTEYDRMGVAAPAMAVLAATVPGMPLIYTGQEDKLSRKLNFFEKDPIAWNDFTLQGFYQKLLTLKHDNKALWNGAAGGSMQIVANSGTNVFSFIRQNGPDKVLVVLNLTDTEQSVKFEESQIFGVYQSLFAQTQVSIEKEANLKLEPWGYLVLTAIK
ncbi:MAG: hypothetical protein A2W95_18400 [Bacteroidetes bacterium GWA2_40_14]|nr:MAG: hypothetical protein A2W95_18400 [Bacteroidetes bacterium GWA2_40_14]